MQTQGRGEILAAEAPAVVTVSWMPKVGMPVDVDESTAIRHLRRQSGGDQHAAVSAEYERCVTGATRFHDAVREESSVGDDGLLIAYGAGITMFVVVDVPTGQDNAPVRCTAGPQRFVQSRLSKCLRRFGGSGNRTLDGRAQSKIRWGGDECDHETQASIASRDS